VSPLTGALNANIVNGNDQPVNKAVERNAEFVKDVFLFTASCSFSPEQVLIV
jgi:hypothetical protein